MLRLRNSKGFIRSMMVCASVIMVAFLVVGCDTGADECKGCVSLSDITIGSDVELIGDGTVDALDNSHPLTAATGGYTEEYFSEDDLQAVLAYKAAYDSLIMLPSEQVIVGSYSYAYENNRSAKKAASLVQGMLEAQAGFTVTDVASIKTANGKQYIAISPEAGSTVMWHIGTRDNVLIMIMANGMDGEVVAAEFGIIVNTVFGN